VEVLGPSALTAYEYEGWNNKSCLRKREVRSLTAGEEVRFYSFKVRKK